MKAFEQNFSTVVLGLKARLSSKNNKIELKVLLRVGISKICISAYVDFWSHSQVLQNIVKKLFVSTLEINNYLGVGWNSITVSCEFYKMKTLTLSSWKGIYENYLKVKLQMKKKKLKFQK